MGIVNCYVSWPKGKLQTCNSECDEPTVQHNSKDIFYLYFEKQSIQNSPALEALKVKPSLFQTSTFWISIFFCNKKHLKQLANNKKQPPQTPWFCTKTAFFKSFAKLVASKTSPPQGDSQGVDPENSPPKRDHFNRKCIFQPLIFRNSLVFVGVSLYICAIGSKLPLFPYNRG